MSAVKTFRPVVASIGDAPTPLAYETNDLTTLSYSQYVKFTHGFRLPLRVDECNG